MDELKNIYRKNFDEVCIGILTNKEKITLGLEKKDFITPWELIHNLSNQIIDDAENLFKQNILHNSLVNLNVDVIGDKKNILSYDATPIINPGVIFDTTNGPIILGRNTLIYPFSLIKGPCFIGNNSYIKDARIYGGCSIGNHCKISGELENSIIGNYTNKSHESALLHSYVGDWCNLGGYSKTPDLKIDYSLIDFRFKKALYKTNKIKLGVFISDYVRIGAGVTTFPRTMIDYGSTILELPVIKGYYKPFTKFFKNKTYSLDDFLKEIKIIMNRRGVKVTDVLIEKWQKIKEENIFV